jgi:hypothetical protein
LVLIFMIVSTEGLKVRLCYSTDDKDEELGSRSNCKCSMM